MNNYHKKQVTLILEFTIGDTVYFMGNAENKGIVTGVMMRQWGNSYLVTWEEDLNERHHYSFELSLTKGFE